MRAWRRAKVGPNLTSHHIHVCYHSIMNFIGFSLCLHLIHLRMLTLVVTTAPIGAICSVCGIIKKSGKLSCCGRGGSWFEKCGSVGNGNLGHAWYEGIRACRTPQSQAAADQQLHASQLKQTHTTTISPDNMIRSPRTNLAIADFTRVPAVSIPTWSHTPVSASLTARESDKSLSIVIYIIVVHVIVY